VRELLDILLRHPRFEWLKIQRNFEMQRVDKPARSFREANARLMPRVVESCENLVLGIVHRTFSRLGWHVLAKVFDGLIAEPGPGPCASLESTMQQAQEDCCSNDWYVQLVEKPLYGLQEDPLPSVAEARLACRDVALYTNMCEASGSDGVVSTILSRTESLLPQPVPLQMPEFSLHPAFTRTTVAEAATEVAKEEAVEVRTEVGDGRGGECGGAGGGTGGGFGPMASACGDDPACSTICHWACSACESAKWSTRTRKAWTRRACSSRT